MVAMTDGSYIDDSYIDKSYIDDSYNDDSYAFLKTQRMMPFPVHMSLHAIQPDRFDNSKRFAKSNKHFLPFT